MGGGSERRALEQPRCDRSRAVNVAAPSVMLDPLPLHHVFHPADAVARRECGALPQRMLTGGFILAQRAQPHAQLVPERATRGREHRIQERLVALQTVLGILELVELVEHEGPRPRQQYQQLAAIAARIALGLGIGHASLRQLELPPRAAEIAQRHLQHPREMRGMYEAQPDRWRLPRDREYAFAVL